MFITDALSRAYLPKCADDLLNLELDVLHLDLLLSASKLKLIRQATKTDKYLQRLSDIILQGWPVD